MTLDPPLTYLFDHCETLCLGECCGLSAFDFSPVHIASFFTNGSIEPDESEIAKVREQLQTLKANYGSHGAISTEVTLWATNETYSGERIDALVDEILMNIDAALELLKTSKAQRYKKTPVKSQ